MRRVAVQIDRVGIEWESGAGYSFFWEGSFSLVTDRGRMIMGVWRKETKKGKPLIISEYRLRKADREEVARLINKLLEYEFPRESAPNGP